MSSERKSGSKVRVRMFVIVVLLAIGLIVHRPRLGVEAALLYVVSTLVARLARRKPNRDA
jgi:hypothetical protein